jgi:hypothetical protein
MWPGGNAGLIEVRLLNHTQEYVESFHQMLSEVDAILDAWKPPATPIICSGLP